MTGLKVWNGSAFADGAPKVWNGSAFVDPVSVHIWDGTKFVKVWPVVTNVTVKGTPNSGSFNTVTIPAHSPGDIIVIFANSNSSATPVKPTASGNVPNWQQIAVNNNFSAAGGLWYFVATTNSHTSGAWSNTAGMVAVVLSGQSSTSPIGGNAVAPDANSVTVVPATTLSQTDGTSALLHFGGVTFSVAWDAAPAGYTTLVGGTSPVVCIEKNSSTSDGSVTMTRGGAFGGTIGATLEIRAH